MNHPAKITTGVTKGAKTASGSTLGISKGIAPIQFTFPNSNLPYQVFEYPMEVIESSAMPTIIGTDFFVPLKAHQDYDKKVIKLRLDFQGGNKKLPSPSKLREPLTVIE